jgi:hypothetical protein
MSDDPLKLIWKANGYMDAQLIKNYLESFGIAVYNFEESVGLSYGLTVGPLGEVELYVPTSQAEEAQQYMRQYAEASGQDEPDFDDE